MRLQENDVQTLKDLGLTIPQGKVYLALLRLGGDAKASTIFRLSKVARQDVYRILAELQQLGVVVKIIAKPTRFRAIPIKEVVSVLLERKICSISELREKARELTEKVVKNYAKTAIQQEKDEFILVSEKEAIILKNKEAVEAVQENICIIVPFREFVQWTATLSESFNKALRRGVNVRLITEKTGNASSWPEIVQTLIKNPKFDLRTVIDKPKTKFAIYDEELVFMALFTGYDDAAESPGLMSNNPSIIAMAEEFFEMKWMNAREHELKISGAK